MSRGKLEKSLEEAGNREVAKRGGYAVKLVPWVDTGLPDRLYLLPGGVMWFVEWKAPGKADNLSARQKKWRDRLVALGFNYLVTDSLETFIERLWGSPGT